MSKKKQKPTSKVWQHKGKGKVLRFKAMERETGDGVQHREMGV